MDPVLIFFTNKRGQTLAINVVIHGRTRIRDAYSSAGDGSDFPVDSKYVSWLLAEMTKTSVRQVTETFCLLELIVKFDPFLYTHKSVWQ